eukprot:scaffold7028_cov243-Pinguiococcus_pyrenoidosus.AAC.8
MIIAKVASARKSGIFEGLHRDSSKFVRALRESSKFCAPSQKSSQKSQELAAVGDSSQRRRGARGQASAAVLLRQRPAICGPRRGGQEAAQGLGASGPLPEPARASSPARGGGMARGGVAGDRGGAGHR